MGTLTVLQLPCRRDPDRQFPDLDDRRAVWRAKNVCRLCPLRQQCLTDADPADEWGVWGGFTAQERRWMRDGKQAIDCAGCGIPFVPWGYHGKRCGRCARTKTAGRRNIKPLEPYRRHIETWAGQGLSDPEMGRRLGFSTVLVQTARKTWDIPAGVMARRGRRPDPSLFRIDLIELVEAGAAPIRELNFTERVAMWRRHKANGGLAKDFINQHRVSWALSRQIRDAAAAQPVQQAA